MQKLRFEMEYESRGSRSGPRDLRRPSMDGTKAAFDTTYDKEGENEREKDQARAPVMVHWGPSWLRLRA